MCNRRSGVMLHDVMHAMYLVVKTSNACLCMQVAEIQTKMKPVTREYLAKHPDSSLYMASAGNMRGLCNQSIVESFHNSNRHARRKHLYGESFCGKHACYMFVFLCLSVCLCLTHTIHKFTRKRTHAHTPTHVHTP